ncbi:YqgE/AlgH family protein [Shimia sp.]|uniref:YqgE/AlgH family protein n=1 Tax=Shimia sp. TaxID=1954381 RepID=UPI00329A2564
MDLTGCMLIAMPGMGDPRFMHSVVFLCAHSEDGAMGLIVNKAIDKMRVSDLLNQLSISLQRPEYDGNLYFGGPVEGGRGFVLHSPEYRSDLSTLRVSDGFAMTATLDVLEGMAQGKGPERTLVALGYSGWGPGQLESEIAANGWLICDATQELVFDLPNAEKWPEALKSIGVDALSLSSTAGHA